MSGIDFQGETEQSLVAALRQGRQEMLGKLYDAYAPIMMGVISRIVQDNEVAEEALKETFVAIWTRIGVYDASKSRLLTWGLAIARGIALEAVRTDRYKTATQHTKNTDETNASPQKKCNFAGRGVSEPESLQPHFPGKNGTGITLPKRLLMCRNGRGTEHDGGGIETSVEAGVHPY